MDLRLAMRQCFLLRRKEKNPINFFSFKGENKRTASSLSEKFFLIF